MKNQEQKKILLAYCDKRFHPYVDKVLQRLPASIRENEVLGDLGLRIISFDAKDLLGGFVDFESPTNCLIILNEVLLDEPESEVIHTIAHEIAHKVAKRREGHQGFKEIEAENLVVKWGFREESEAANDDRPILLGTGFDIGYEWAMSNDLGRFEEFYDEWNEARLSTRRFNELRYEANTHSVLYDMGLKEDSRNEADETPQEGSLVRAGSLDKGIVAGIMCALKDKKTRIKAAHVGNVGLEFQEQLRRTFIEIGKLFGTSIYSRYCQNLPNLGRAYEEIARVLAEARQG